MRRYRQRSGRLQEVRLTPPGVFPLDICWPNILNQSLEPTPIDALGFALAVDIMIPTWLSSRR